MIIILTYGKVASQSVQALLEREFPGEVYYTHGLRNRIVYAVDDFVLHASGDTSGLRAAFRDNMMIQQGLETASRNGQQVTIISGVRDPVLRSLSAAIQNLDMMFSHCIGKASAETVRNLTQYIRRVWRNEINDGDPLNRMRQVTIDAPLHWLADELDGPFGFDILNHPFDVNQGYSVIEKDNFRLLLYRLESAPQAVVSGLQELFPNKNFELPLRNQAQDKPSGHVYDRLKRSFSLARDDLLSIYGNPYVRKFYSETEIRSMIENWSHSEARDNASGMASSSLRAVVVVPTLNHSEWIGKQLESLFAQWRPDLELLIIDDGSSDGTLNAVFRVLEGRPEIVATLLRNERPYGLDVIPQILQFTKAPIFIQADSDDISFPGRLDAVLARFESDTNCKLVTSNALKISSEGFPIGLYDTHHGDAILDDPLLPASERGSSRWLGATEAFHRSLLEDFPPLDTEVLPYGLDLLLALRATLTGSHHYLARPLVGWRQHSRNSHRLVGGLAREGRLRESFAAIELMVLAQKIRDVQFVQERHQHTQHLEAVLARCFELFFGQFREWSKIKVGLQPMANGGESNSYVAAVPPIVTLQQGIRQSFGCTEPLGKAASAWSGFHPAEAGWIWTSRVAVIAFRVGSPGLTGIRVSLHGLPFLETQRVKFYADGIPCQELTLVRDEAVQAEIFLQPQSIFPGFFTLIVEALDAKSPCEFAYNSDARTLGASLRWIEAI